MNFRQILKLAADSLQRGSNTTVYASDIRYGVVVLKTKDLLSFNDDIFRNPRINKYLGTYDLELVDLGKDKMFVITDGTFAVSCSIVRDTNTKSYYIFMEEYRW